MKRILILLIIFCSVLSAKAQFGTGGGSTIVGKIAGTLIDSVSKQSVPYVPITIYRTGGKSAVNGVVADEKGNFKIEGLHPGSYRLEISFMGYKNKVINQVVTTDSKPDKNLGNIFFAPNTKALKEVQITGTASLVENKIDRIVYNAEKDLTSAGGNASDVLQKVPLVSVDINGNVAIRGDQNVRVLINGKPTGASSASLSDVLKTIPADQIKSIEVITSPSAKYDAEGSAGIINIITKQKNMTGISGSVSGGIGTRQNNGNFNLNYNKNRFSLSMNAGGNLTWPQTSLTTFNNDIRGVDSLGHPTHTATATNGTTYLKRHGAIGNVSATYDFNAFNSIHSNIRLNQGGFDPNSTTGTNLTNFIDTASSYKYQSHNIGHNTFGGFDWNLDYTRKFKKEGEELDISTQWSHSKIVTDYTTFYTSQYADQKNNIDGLNNEYTLQLDYTLPINKVFKLEAGGKEIIRRLSSNSALYSPDPLDPNSQDPNSFIYNNLNSSTYDYNQYVTAGYSVLTITLPKGYSILAGARDEITNIHGVPQSAGQTDLQPFNNDYNTFIPSLTIQKQISSTQTIKLSYSKRITRPSLQFLNPYLNTSNVLAQTQGNPNLAPEISQTVELGYNTFIKSSVINLSVYYKHTGDMIENIASPLTNEPGTISTFENAAINNSFGASFFGSINPINILTIRGSINAYTYNPTPYADYVRDFTQTGVYVQYNAFLMAEVDLKSGFIAQVFAVENSPRRTIQGTNPSFSILGAGVRKQFLKKKASLGINTLEPFNKYKYFNTNISSPGFSQSSTFAFPFRSVGLTFSYSFGKTTFSNPQQKKGVNNDDLKQGDSGTPAGGGGPGGR
jgi:outer membrane receptor protein involved in Fe transport